MKLQNAHLTDLHRNDPEYNIYARRLLETAVRQANLAYSRFFQLPEPDGHGPKAHTGSTP